jgi:hypothetical protein
MYLPPWLLPPILPAVINSFDIDGVIYMGEGRTGVFPSTEDIIVTGRSYEEAPQTLKMLRSRGINNQVFFNPLPERDKTRLSSGEWKAKVLEGLLNKGCNIGIHFEDDPVQIDVLRKLEPRLKIVHLQHQLTKK